MLAMSKSFDEYSPLDNVEFEFSSIIACENTSMSLKFQILSSQCTQEQCGTYGSCRITTSQQNFYSVCLCIAGK